MTISGIYKIISPSNKNYIGQSIDCNRMEKHYYRGGGKNKPKLFNSIKKYGWIAHKFKIIHKCPCGELNYWEKYYIIKYNTFNTSNGLNLTSGGDSLWELSQDIKNKISTSNKISLSNPNVRNKMANSAKLGWEKRKARGWKPSDELKVKMAIIVKKSWQNKIQNGYTMPISQKILISQRAKERYKNPEMRKKTSDANMGKKASIETRKKMGLAHKGKTRTLAQRNIMSMKANERWKSIEFRHKMSNVMKKAWVLRKIKIDKIKEV